MLAMVPLYTSRLGDDARMALTVLLAKTSGFCIVSVSRVSIALWGGCLDHERTGFLGSLDESRLERLIDGQFRQGGNGDQ